MRDIFSQVKPIKFDLWRVTVNLNQTCDVLNVNDADLPQSHFVNANLSQAQFSQITMTGTVFNDTNLGASSLMM